jgi:hypothetical protein
LLLNPTRDPITVSPPQPRVRPEELADRKQALHWFQAERPVLLAAIGQAASSGFSAHAWQLPWTATTFFHWRGYWQDLAATQQSALAAARDLDDHPGQAQAHRHLGRAQIRLGAYADASAHLAEALDLGRLAEHGSRRGAGSAPPAAAGALSPGRYVLARTAPTGRGGSCQAGNRRPGRWRQG